MQGRDSWRVEPRLWRIHLVCIQYSTEDTEKIFITMYKCSSGQYCVDIGDIEHVCIELVGICTSVFFLEVYSDYRIRYNIGYYMMYSPYTHGYLY